MDSRLVNHSYIANIVAPGLQPIKDTIDPTYDEGDTSKVVRERSVLFDDNHKRSTFIEFLEKTISTTNSFVNDELSKATQIIQLKPIKILNITLCIISVSVSWSFRNGKSK